MDDVVKVIPLSLKLCPQSPSIKTPLWQQTNCMWLKRQNVLLAVMESRKGLTMNRWCFSSTTNMNYDNWGILVVKPKEQENQYFEFQQKSSLWHQEHASDLTLISGLPWLHQNQWDHFPSLAVESQQLGGLDTSTWQVRRNLQERVSSKVRYETSLYEAYFSL